MSKILERKLETTKIKYFLSNDVAFKTFFRKNHSMLKKVICMSTKIKEQEIKKMTLLNTELIKDTTDDKLGILDLLVEINDDKQINIEMQNVDKNNLPERLEFYLSKKFVENIEEGEDYSNLKHVYGIYFLNYNDKNFPNFYSVIGNYDIINEELTKTLKTIIVYNLCKINEIDKYNFTEEEKDILRFIKSKNEGELINMAERRISLNEAMKQLREINADKELKALLFHAEIKRLDELSDKKWKERIVNERNEALKERNDIIKERNDVIKERNDVIKERDAAIKEINNIINEKNEIINDLSKNEITLKETKNALNKTNNVLKKLEKRQKETVLNMLKDNLDINIISKYTNLPSDEILKIKNLNT